MNSEKAIHIETWNFRDLQKVTAFQGVSAYLRGGHSVPEKVSQSCREIQTTVDICMFSEAIGRVTQRTYKNFKFKRGERESEIFLTPTSVCQGELLKFCFRMNGPVSPSCVYRYWTWNLHSNTGGRKETTAVSAPRDSGMEDAKICPSPPPCGHLLYCTF